MYFGQIFNLSPVEIHCAIEPDTPVTSLNSINSFVNEPYINAAESVDSMFVDTDETVPHADQSTIKTSSISSDDASTDTIFQHSHNHTYHAYEGSVPKGKGF